MPLWGLTIRRSGGAERIVALAHDPTRRLALGEAAAAHVALHFSPVPIAKRFAALCAEAMAS